MTKNEIKLALTEAGITFRAKATLEELTSLFQEQVAKGVAAAEELRAVAEDHSIKPGAPLSAEELAAYTVTDDHSLTNCPHCNIGLDNGLLHVTDCAANTDKSYMEQRDPAFEAGEWMCMGCGGHFGEPVVYAPKVEGLKIEKDRPEQNGVKRPSVGGRCRAVWDALDSYLAETGDQPTAKVVKDLAADEGWNPNNASIEFYQWRKFHGIKGRQPKVEAPAD